jgi:hypothetical protein
MNSILMIVIAVVILLLVFVMFSLDDQEEDNGFLKEGREENGESGEVSSEPPQAIAEIEKNLPEQPLPVVSREKTPVRPIARVELPEKLPLVDAGNEEDLRLRIQLDQRLPLPIAAEEKDAVVAAVQLRFPEESMDDKDAFLKLMARAEALFDRSFSFDFSCFSGSQLDRIWIFGRDEGRDDALFEALVVAFEVVSRFKKALENDSVLRDNKVRVAIGLSMGKLLKIGRGISTEPSWVGKSAYLAETLAEAAAIFLFTWMMKFTKRLCHFLIFASGSRLNCALRFLQFLCMNWLAGTNRMK